MPEKKTKLKVGLKNLAMLSSYFDYIFVHLRQKNTSQARIQPEILVNCRPEPEPDSKNPAQLTTLNNHAPVQLATWHFLEKDY